MGLIDHYSLHTWLERCRKGQINIKFPGEDVLCKRSEGKHFHLHHELFLQLEGASHFFFPMEDIVLEKGELLMIPSGVPHSELATGEGPMQNLVLIAHPPHWFAHLGISLPGKHPSVKNLRSYRPYKPKTTLKQLDLLVEAKREGTRRESLNALFYAFLMMLEASKKVPQKRSSIEQNKPSLVDRCIDLVHTSYNMTECNVQYIAKELDCSPSHLSRTFSKKTGKGLHTVIMDYRMQQAKHHLKEGRFNVSETALSCGFEDVSHFVARFRKAFGVTPKQFGLQMKGVVRLPN